MNRTCRYFLPIIWQIYGNKFANDLRSLNVLDLFLKDDIYLKPDCLYIKCDPNGNKRGSVYIAPVLARSAFNDFLNAVRNMDFYEHDYPLDKKITGHMIVLKLPFSTESLFKGDYNVLKTYTYKQHHPAYHRLNKTITGKVDYVNELNTMYGTNLSVSDIEHHTSYDHGFNNDDIHKINREG